MENKMIFLRRIIYIICVALSLIFITLKGGNLSYMLFSMMMVNTIVSIVYIVYVFFTIRIYQIIPERRVTKQEFVSYNLLLNNESFMAYRDVRLKFERELSEIKGADKIGYIGMEPGQEMNIHKELFCKYSGTYFVGVDSIEIMDYFKIFCIRFQMPQKMKVTVKPRVIKLDNIFFLTEMESHGNSLARSREFQLDNEVRKYYQGDNKRHIHWKNSAKKQELMVRNCVVEENSQFVVIMDGSMGKLEFNERIICCDKLRETVLAIVNYIYNSGYYVETILDSIYEKEINSGRDFNELYNRLIDYGFGQEKKSAGHLFTISEKYGENIPFILVTSKHSVLTENAIEQLRQIRNVFVINVDLYETVEDIFNMEN